MIRTVYATAQRLVKTRDASEADLRGAVTTLDAVIDAYAKENTSTFWSSRWLVLALLRVGDYDRAIGLAKQHYVESCDEKQEYMTTAFKPAAFVHLLVAGGAPNEAAAEVPPPTPESYGKAAHQWDATVLGPIFDRLPGDARSMLAARLGPRWDRWFTATSGP
jgi:hypothetical protein